MSLLLVGSTLSQLSSPSPCTRDVQDDALSHLGQQRFGALPGPGRAHFYVAGREARLKRARARVVSEELQCSHHPRTLEEHARAPRQYTEFLKDYFGSAESGWRESRPDLVCAYLYDHLLPNLKRPRWWQCADLHCSRRRQRPAAMF